MTPGFTNSGISVGVQASSGEFPRYSGTGSSVHRDATDAKNILYTVTTGTWYPGNAEPASRTAIRYDFYSDYIDGSGYVLRQQSSSSQYNAGADQSGNGDHRHYVQVFVWNDNTWGGMTSGVFGNAYPSANPWVWSD